MFFSLLLLVCCFYSLKQERCKFGKTGWNDNYDFNEFDYEAAAWALSSFTQNASHSVGSSFQWDDLKYFIAEVCTWLARFFTVCVCPYVEIFLHLHRTHI